MYVCVYICIYIYVCIYIHIYIHTYILYIIHLHISCNVYIYVYIYIHTYIHTYILCIIHLHISCILARVRHGVFEGITMIIDFAGIAGNRWTPRSASMPGRDVDLALSGREREREREGGREGERERERVTEMHACVCARVQNASILSPIRSLPPTHPAQISPTHCPSRAPSAPVHPATEVSRHQT